ncbi:MAG TPA: prephenate dehydrogenase/arogenate dehydrogenase family protein [Acidimicrobiia bacterium]|nr:prephenate dehydrogenase/arogenate dehydrogenase family protein [Acidimicrobiia bacterium]
MSAPRATIVGTGLLGTSVGLSLRARGWKVSGWDPNPTSLDRAVGRGALDNKLIALDLANADLVVLAAPPDAVVSTLASIDTDTLVTDVASVKKSVIAAARHLSHFIGGHPMAGGETSGPEMASSSMFHGATWVLTTDGADHGDLQRMREIVSSLGANPIEMTAAEHDIAVARVSHLPHVLAAVLMNLAQDDPATLALAGGGFRDLTRIAAGESGWWSEVLVANSDQVSDSIDRLDAALDRWRSASKDELVALLESARQARLGLGEHNTQVRVILVDKPGEIARVGHALEQSRVDVRDFQLRHGEHGGGGILTISVRGEGRDALTMALIDEGFEVRTDA